MCDSEKRRHYVCVSLRRGDIMCVSDIRCAPRQETLPLRLEENQLLGPGKRKISVCRTNEDLAHRRMKICVCARRRIFSDCTRERKRNALHLPD